MRNWLFWFIGFMNGSVIFHPEPTKLSKLIVIFLCCISYVLLTMYYNKENKEKKK